MKPTNYLAVLLAMADMGTLEHYPVPRKIGKQKTRSKKRDCKICGDPVFRDSLTCSKECFLEHKKQVNNR